MRHMFCKICDSNVGFTINIDRMKVCSNCGDASKAFHSRKRKNAPTADFLAWLNAQEA